jgi:DNA end-binding protein Ku
MSRAIWKGAISFGLVNIPVELHSAEQRDELSFDLLDRRDMSPVGYRRYNKNTGKEVEWEEIVKGYEYEDGEYVVLSDEDFRQANVRATQTVDIVSFVDAAEIHPIYYDTPYHLAPVKRGEKGYALLRETLRRSGRIGIAKVVIRTRQHLAALLPYGPMLVLELMRFPDDLRSIDEYELPSENLASAGLSAKEVEMAEHLVEGMLEKWDPNQYHDEYRQDLLTLIEKKVKSGNTHTLTAPPQVEKQPKSAKVIDLMSLLKKSVQQAGQPGRSAERVQAKAKKPPAKKTRKRA